MKFLTLIAVNLVVLGVLWLNRQTSLDDQGQPAQSVISDARSDPSMESASKPVFGSIAEELSAEEKTDDDVEGRPELLKEYWALLLSNKRQHWCPSKRVDMFKELEFIFAMSSDEAREHLNAIMSLEGISWYDRRELVSPLVLKMASENPVEAISYLVESSNSFHNEEYEGVVRMWMDQDAPGVMDWYESNLETIKAPLVQAFFSVYAEEEPYEFLFKYGTHELSRRNTDAVRLLYADQGSSVYEGLKNDGLDPKVLAGSYKDIGRVMFQENATKAIDWIQSNRYSVDQGTTKQLASDLLNNGYYSNETAAIETLEWALKQNVFSSNDRTTKKIVRNMSRWNTEPTRELLQRLQTQAGIDTEELLEVLPKLRDEEDELIYLEPFEVNVEEGEFILCGLSFEAVRNSEIPLLLH